MGDLRSLKTKEAIAKDYIHLLDEMTFEQITVSRIIQDCRINRSTFYRHYKDKYDLAQKFNEDILADLERAVRQLHATAEHVDKTSLMPLIHFFHKNQATFYVIAKRNMPYNLFRDMLNLTAEHIKKEIEAATAQRSLDSRYLSFFSRLIASNILETIKWWHCDWPEKSDEEVVSLIIETIEHGIYPSLDKLFDIIRP